MPLILPQHAKSYSLWLKSQNYQPNTIRNYLFDLQLFLKSSGNQLSLKTLSAFISSNTNQNNSLRHLASISKFCQFLFDQKLTDQNLFLLAKKQLTSTPRFSVSDLLAEFSVYLTHQGKSPITIKNYQGDLRQFIDFCEHR
jgi:site-specific recombinase XerD